MLPFLKKQNETSVAVPTDKIKRASDSPDEDYDVMDSASEDLHAAVHAGDIKGISAALRAAHDLHKAEQSEDSDNE